MPQDNNLPYPDLGYEERIFQNGLVATRTANWHDLFNAMIWARFPRSKRAVNALHFEHHDLRTPEGNRTSIRDAATLLDECGVLVASTHRAAWVKYNQAHRWRDMFLDQRDSWGRTVDAVLFGHGLLEQCLRPYCGLTGKALYLDVPPGWFELAAAQRYAVLDRLLAGFLQNHGALSGPGALLPLPVLGIPGWCEDNETSSYYENTDYFRPGPET